jgi:hypothetical protein
MKVLLETATPQVLSFIPREYLNIVNYTLTNESTNVTTSFTNIDAVTNGAYLELTEVFDLKEGVFYNYDITNPNDNDLLYRGRIFCTNQDIDTFSMNKDEYIEDDSKNNEYIIYNG